MIGVMVDLETMGQGTDAAIISIGAVHFDTCKRTIESTFYSEVNLESSLQLGLKIDASTVLWWMKQSEAARKAFKHNEKARDIYDVLTRFEEWYPERATFWGNGATFDNVILSTAYDLYGIEKPWKYWEDRCFRTLCSLYPEISVSDVGTAHNALDDALYQTELLLEIYRQKGLN